MYLPCVSTEAAVDELTLLCIDALSHVQWNFTLQVHRFHKLSLLHYKYINAIQQNTLFFLSAFTDFSQAKLWSDLEVLCSLLDIPIDNVTGQPASIKGFSHEMNFKQK